MCGSCYAFSAISALESAYVLAGYPQVIMSPQEIIDCTNSTNKNLGCNGGWYYWAYDWLRQNKAMSESDYPYVSGTTATVYQCQYNEARGLINVNTYQQVAPDSQSIMDALMIGPVNVAIAAENETVRNYKSGILTEYDYCSDTVDHAVVVVGYGYEGNQGYYIVRNSWNTWWGEEGYMRIGISNNGNGICGINQQVFNVWVNV